MDTMPPSLLTDPRFRATGFSSNLIGQPYGRAGRTRPGVQAMPDISTIADAVAAQQLQAQQVAPPARAPLPAYIDPTNPGALAYGAQQAMQSAQAAKQFNRQIAPNLPSALLPDEVNANRYAYMSQLAAQAAGGPSVQTNDMLAAPAVQGTTSNGRPSLTQNPASLAAATQGLDPQSLNQKRTFDLANAYAESQVPKPQGMEVQFPDGTKEKGIFSNGNFTRITPEKPTTNLPRSSIGDLQFDLARAEAEGRSKDAEDLRAALDDARNPSGKPLTVMEFNFAQELRKQYAGDYGRYRAAFAEQVKQARQPAAPVPAPAAIRMTSPQPVLAPATAAPAAANPDADAAAWLQANPNHPFAAQVRAKLNSRTQ